MKATKTKQAVAKRGKAIAPKAAAALATQSDLFAHMAADAGKGIEQADKDSFAVPFILCLQQMSPQCEVIDGAKPGLFINSVTNELSKAVRVIPVYFERLFLRWLDRDAGGGFRGAYSALEVEELIAEGEAERSDDGLSIRVGEDEALKDTRQHYVLAEDANGSWSPAIIACSSTQIKKSKNWLTQINNFKIEHDGQTFTPPSWARIYTLTSVKESNNKGSWHGISITPEPGTVDAPLYALGQKFYNQIVAGKVRVQHEDLSTTEGSQAEDKF